MYALNLFIGYHVAKGGFCKTKQIISLEQNNIKKYAKLIIKVPYFLMIYS